ncbi:HindVP family restriction endonuclease [Thermoproteota archaeon]
MSSPTLFGLKRSNRNFNQEKSWGKNKFNTAFPTALACFMDHINVKPVYFELDHSYKVVQRKIGVDKIFGMKPKSPRLQFEFESSYRPYYRMVESNLPRNDLVTVNTSTTTCLKTIEIKLTALPDDVSSSLSEEQYGCEIVVRPDTIVYLALSIASIYRNRRSELRTILKDVCSRIRDWEKVNEVKPHVNDIKASVNNLLIKCINAQSPFMMQPIWKTIGSTLQLENNCFDIFVWSDFAFTRLFVDAKDTKNPDEIKRPIRSLIWLAKMLYDFARNNKINASEIIDKCTYNTKNDKAFSVNGKITNRYMKCNELLRPRIEKNELKNIILGGGEKFLQPERRLDAAILAVAPEIFG